jgi:hypothetical protein
MDELPWKPKQVDNGVSIRVTRLGEFSLIGWQFTLGSFLLQKWPIFLGYFFPLLRLWINSDEKTSGLHFGQFFTSSSGHPGHKLVMLTLFWVVLLKCIICLFPRYLCMCQRGSLKTRFESPRENCCRVQNVRLKAGPNNAIICTGVTRRLAEKGPIWSKYRPKWSPT